MDKKDTLTFLWNEFDLRQQHYWRIFGKLVLAFPLSAFVLSLFSSWLLGAESQRLRMVKQKYDELSDQGVPRMPRDTWWERRLAMRLGSSIAMLFGVGLTAFSVLNAFVLWAYPIK